MPYDMNVYRSRFSRIVRFAVLTVLLGLSAASQRPAPPEQQEEQPDITLPNGKSQREEILKQEHQKSLRDIARIQTLAGELKSDLEKNDYHVLSLSALKKAEELEKLARQVRNRMRQ
jgi:hypothetical protein